ncbi:MAG TPA: serine hydrolase domain-containing protein [Candidatus Binatia bacterium]|nr:serine hydrolase domain-containing protein [Candidatus Binatia bacterium]
MEEPRSTPSDGPSRRRVLAGAAAGLASWPLLRGGATAAPFGFGGGPFMRTEDGDVSGTWHPRFRRVRDEFVRNFAERGELGASVCVIFEGRTVIDLWGGIASRRTGAPWRSDTLVQVWSSTKGATALCAHILVDRGLLDLDSPVVRYWPEYGQNGKEATTVAMLLGHQAGVPAIREPLPAGAFYDWELMTGALAAEAPFWEPGTRNGYHALTFGFLVGELVRRVSGKSLGTFFRDEVARRLGLDFWIGLPETEEARVAPTIAAALPGPGEEMSLFLLKALTDPTSIPALIFFNNGGYTNFGESDSRAAHAAEIGASGGITNARGLANLYAPLAGIGGIELASRDTRARMARVHSATGADAVAFLPTRFALGYVKSMDNRHQPPGNRDSVVLSEEAFGHSGFGGSIGFADPRGRFAFGYAMTKMGQGTGINPRGQSLVDAVYESLGYASEASGSWTPGGRRTPRSLI